MALLTRVRQIRPRAYIRLAELRLLVDRITSAGSKEGATFFIPGGLLRVSWRRLDHANGR